MDTVPRAQMDTFLETVLAAVYAAESGRAQVGYTFLKAACRRAARPTTSTTAWAPELVRHYERAIALYVVRWQTALDLW